MLPTIEEASVSATEASPSPNRLMNNQNSDVYDDGYLRVEHNSYYVECDGQSVRLSRTEFLILSRLARSMERTVPAEELWRSAWRSQKPFNSESLHVYIYRLRAQLKPYKLRIDTMINVGYRLFIDKALHLLLILFILNSDIVNPAIDLIQTS